MVSSSFLAFILRGAVGGIIRTMSFSSPQAVHRFGFMPVAAMMIWQTVLRVVVQFLLLRVWAIFRRLFFLQAVA